jgi:hypothetical protein
MEQAGPIRPEAAPAGHRVKRQIPNDYTFWSFRRIWGSRGKHTPGFPAGRNQRGFGASDTLTIEDLRQYSVVSGQFSVVADRWPLETPDSSAIKGRFYLITEK